MTHRIRLLLRSLLHRRQIERDLDDEFAFHLAMQAEENRRAGMTESESRIAAQRQFGGVTQGKEGCRDYIFGWINGFIQDLRFASHSFRKSPGFSSFVVLTLAFGIGVNLTVFSIVNAVLLQSLPYPEPDRIVVIAGAYSVPAYELYAQETKAFAGVAAWVDESMSLVASGSAERIRGARVTASFFPVLGVQPLVGRLFQTTEDRPGGPAVALLSFAAWQNRFGGDTRIVGRVIRLNADSVTVIGILPASFWFPGEPVEVWAPRVFDNRFVSPLMVRNGAGILTDIIARLNPGISLEQGDAAVRIANAGLNGQYSSRLDTRLQPLQQSATVDIRPSLLLLWGAATSILLMTCANTAGLLLARATSRRHEFAVRLALGVSRSRLVRQLTTETLPFAVAGGAIGLLLARFGLDAMTTLTGTSLTDWRPVDLSTPVLSYAVGLSAIASVVFGLSPAVQSLRDRRLDHLQDASRGGSSRAQPRLRSMLVVAQTAVAVVLAMSAALLLQSYTHMRNLRTGIRTEGLVTASIRLPDTRYGTGRERVEFYDELLRRLGDTPGVTNVAATSALHLQARGEGSMTLPEGTPMGGTKPPIVRNRNVSAHYFRTLGIPLVDGREFTEADDASSQPVMMVNESFARKYFPGGQTIGRRVTYTSERATAQIVGVIPDVRPRMTDAAPEPEMYFPYKQRSRHAMNVVVRSHLPLTVVEHALREILQKIDAEQPAYSLQTMEGVIGGVLSRPRSTSSLVTFFSTSALLLAAIGIYGVLAFSVAQRSREIGIRLALGAQASHIRRIVMRQSLMLVGTGVTIGLPLSLAVGHLSSTLLFGITAFDPLTIVVVIAVVAAVGSASAYFPARHATQIDPLNALR